MGDGKGKKPWGLQGDRNSDLGREKQLLIGWKKEGDIFGQETCIRALSKERIF